MKLELFLSTASYRADAMLVDKLSENRKSGGNHIVIVPDRFTLSMERSILKDLGIMGAFDITVTSFRRLGLRLLGKKAEGCMSAEGSVLLLSKVIFDKKDELKYFVGMHKKPGFASEIYAVLTLVRNSGITVDALKRAIPTLPEITSRKCSDIVLLYEAYLEALAGGKVDGSLLLELLARESPENDIIADSDIYICDYFSFTEAQRAVIFSLIKSAKSVNIATCEGRGRNARI